MQQIVQERLRQRTPATAAAASGPTAPALSIGRASGPWAPGPGNQRHPSSSGIPESRSRAGAPAGHASLGSAGHCRLHRRSRWNSAGHAAARRPTASQRYERQAEKKLESPFVRPQPKPEPQREFRKVTLTEGLTVKDLAEKLDVLDQGHAEES